MFQRLKPGALKYQPSEVGRSAESTDAPKQQMLLEAALLHLLLHGAVLMLACCISALILCLRLSLPLMPFND